MNINGIVVGAAIFLIIGIFHPIVIKMEYYLGKQSWWILLASGIFFSVLSLLMKSFLFSTIAGAAAFSCFWGILEIFQQEKRVLRGWFPENPKRKAYYDMRRKEINY